jgi:hypothetical protein
MPDHTLLVLALLWLLGYLLPEGIRSLELECPGILMPLLLSPRGLFRELLRLPEEVTPPYSAGSPPGCETGCRGTGRTEWDGAGTVWPLELGCIPFRFLAWAAEVKAQD